jgi:hypothetical protein
MNSDIDMDNVERVIQHIKVKDMLYSIENLRLKPRREDMEDPELVHEMLKDVEIKIVWIGEEDGQEVIDSVPAYEFGDESWADVISDTDGEYVKDVMDAGQIYIALYCDMLESAYRKAKGLLIKGEITKQEFNLWSIASGRQGVTRNRGSRASSVVDDAATLARDEESAANRSANRSGAGLDSNTTNGGEARLLGALTRDKSHILFFPLDSAHVIV